MNRLELKREGRLWLTYAELDDALKISKSLRLNAQRECAIHDVSPIEALTESFGLKGSVTYSIFVDEEVIAMLGTVPFDEDNTKASVWFLGTYGIQKHYRPFLRGCKGVIEILQGEYEEISNVVPVEHSDTIMWLMWCGFTFRNETFNINGFEMLRFVRCRKIESNVIRIKQRPVFH